MRLHILLCLIFALSFAGCSNVFKSVADKNSDEALYEDAQKAMDSQDWDAALTSFSSLSPSFQAHTEVIESWAGAYAGKCGLNFIVYFTDLTSATLSSSTLFKYLMNAWTQKMVTPQYCKLAQQKLEEISTDPAARNTGQNIFMAILGMVKIGVYLRYYTDMDGSGGLGDGTKDAAVNVCTNNASNLPDAALDEVITGMGLITTNLSSLTTVLGAGDITNALSTMQTACAVAPGACGKTNTSSIVQADRDLYRDLLNTSSTNPSVPVGIGACNAGVFITCCP